MHVAPWSPGEQITEYCVKCWGSQQKMEAEPLGSNGNKCLQQTRCLHFFLASSVGHPGQFGSGSVWNTDGYSAGVSAGFWSSQTFGGRGCGCLLAALPSPSIAGVWPDPVLFQAGRCSHVRTAAPGVHTCARCPGEILWHAAGDGDDKPTSRPPSGYWLAVHAPIISSSTLAEPDRSIAKAHSQRRAKAARPASFQNAASHRVTWYKGRWDIKSKKCFLYCFKSCEEQRCSSQY